MYDTDDQEAPHSQSSVSLKLSLIQKRCNQLMDDNDGLTLTLEDSDIPADNSDPYNRVR